MPSIYFDTWCKIFYKNSAGENVHWIGKDVVNRLIQIDGTTVKFRGLGGVVFLTIPGQTWVIKNL